MSSDIKVWDGSVETVYDDGKSIGPSKKLTSGGEGLNKINRDKTKSSSGGGRSNNKNKSKSSSHVEGRKEASKNGRNSGKGGKGSNDESQETLTQTIGRTIKTVKVGNWLSSSVWKKAKHSDKNNNTTLTTIANMKATVIIMIQAKMQRTIRFYHQH